MLIEGESTGGAGDCGSRSSSLRRRIQPAALFDPRRSGHSHDRILQGLSAALSLVPQPGKPCSRAGGGGCRGPLYRLPASAWGGDRPRAKGRCGQGRWSKRERITAFQRRSMPDGRAGGCWAMGGRWQRSWAPPSRDRLFFDGSGGGVTFSGGEPLAQPLVSPSTACGRWGEESIPTPPSIPPAVLRGESLLKDCVVHVIFSSTTSSRWRGGLHQELIGVPFEQVTLDNLGVAGPGP